MLHDEQFRGIFCAGIGGLNLLFSFILFRSKKAEINILYLLIGITLTFISLTAPIQLHGHFITLFWAAESVLLYWLYKKSGITLMRLASLIIWVAMLISLLIDWAKIYTSPNLVYTIIANKGFITTICTAVSSWLLFVLVNNNGSKPLIPPAVYKYVAVVLLFAAGALEINQQFLSRYPSTGLNVLYLLLYFPAFVYVFTIFAAKLSNERFDQKLFAIVYAFTIVVYMLVIPRIFDLQTSMLVTHKISEGHFIAHWIGDIFVLLIFYELIMVTKNKLQEYAKPISWTLSGVLVLFFSLEICLLSNHLFYSTHQTISYIENIYIKTVLPVLWGVSSFILMWLGMCYKTRVLRIISLTLFTITLIKLFVFDIQNIPAAGKIAAFFCLGVLLLIISFMYQKVKNIIADDAPKE